MLLFCLSLVCGNLTTAESENPTELKLLVYNTHGLPAVFSKDDPVRRFPEIGKQMRRYQLALLQEDFAHHEALLDTLAASSVAVRGNESRFSLCPFCSGSGLTMISNLEQEWQLEIQAEAFDTCAGWLRGLNDCFATKGFQLSRMETPSGKRFFVVNTHLDAGRTTSDRQARVGGGGTYCTQCTSGFAWARWRRARTVPNAPGIWLVPSRDGKNNTGCSEEVKSISHDAKIIKG